MCLHGGLGLYELMHVMGFTEPDLELLLAKGALQSPATVLTASEPYNNANSCHKNVVGYWFNNPDCVIVSG